MKKPKNSAGFIQIVLMLAVVVLVGGGMYYFGTLKNKTGLTQVVPTPTASQASTGDLTDWKTYNDSKNGFLFKYPSNWRLEKIDLGVDGTFGNIGEYQLSINNAKIVNGSNFSLIDIDPWGYASEGVNSTAKLVDKSFNNLNRSTYFFKNNVGNSVYYYRDFNLKSYPNFSINVNYSDQDLQTINQILSTFKFLAHKDEIEEITNAARSTYTTTAFLEDATIAQDSLNIMDGWAFGVLTIPGKNTPEAHYFIARKTDGKWHAAPEYSYEFKYWLDISPDELVNKDLKKLLK